MRVMNLANYSVALEEGTVLADFEHAQIVDDFTTGSEPLREAATADLENLDVRHDNDRELLRASIRQLPATLSRHFSTGYCGTRMRCRWGGRPRTCNSGPTSD